MEFEVTKILFLYYNKLIKKEVFHPNQPTKFFEQRYVVLAGPFTTNEYSAINNGLMKRGKEIIASRRLKHYASAPFYDVLVPTERMDLAPFGRKIVTGISSLIMAAIAIAGYINIIR